MKFLRSLWIAKIDEGGVEFECSLRGLISFLIDLEGRSRWRVIRDDILMLRLRGRVEDLFSESLMTIEGLVEGLGANRFLMLELLLESKFERMWSEELLLLRTVSDWAVKI